MQGPRSTLVRGTIAGMIGAATLALFFLVFDLSRGTPFNTLLQLRVQQAYGG